MSHRHDVAAPRIVAAGAAIAATVALVVATIVLALHLAGVPPDGQRDAHPDATIGSPDPIRDPASRTRSPDAIQDAIRDPTPRTARTPDANREPPPAANPTLEPAPQPALQRYLADKHAQLHATGWIDRPAGIAHIPIDAAMALIAEGVTRAEPVAPENTR